MTIFKGFERIEIDTGSAVIAGVRGGEGYPVLLLHGYPQTKAMWHLVAQQLSRSFTVIATDLRGYGESSKPPSSPDHRSYSKRTMAADQVAVMTALGFHRFCVVGHDRGGRCAYRMALDYPDRVARLSLLDILPTSEMFQRVDADVATRLWRWFFMAQPAGLPEILIAADPERFCAEASAWQVFSAEAAESYRQSINDPETIRATCEDYRAGMTIDLRDESRHETITCPVLVLWGRRGHLESWFDVLEIWRRWANDVRGRGIDCGHYLAEEAPDIVSHELTQFLQSPENARPEATNDQKQS